MLSKWKVTIALHVALTVCIDSIIKTVASTQYDTFKLGICDNKMTNVNVSEYSTICKPIFIFFYIYFIGICFSNILFCYIYFHNILFKSLSGKLWQKIHFKSFQYALFWLVVFINIEYDSYFPSNFNLPKSHFWLWSIILMTSKCLHSFEGLIY